MRRKGTVIPGQRPKGRPPIKNAIKPIWNDKPATDLGKRNRSLTTFLKRGIPAENHEESDKHNNQDFLKRLPVDQYRKLEENNLSIQNCYASLLNLIEAVYPPLVCPICCTTFLSQKEADSHNRAAHQALPRFPCMHPHCDMAFQSRGGLRFHISKSHIVERSRGRPPRNPSLLHHGGPRQGHFAAGEPSQSKASYTIDSLPTYSLEDTGDHFNNSSLADTAHSPDQSTLYTQTSHQVSEDLPSDEHYSRHPSTQPPVLTEHRPSLTDNGSSSRASPDSDTTISAASSTLPHIKVLQWPTKIPRRRKPSLSAASEVLLNAVYDPLRCPSCRASFPRKTNVIKHLVEFHQGEEPYRCIFQRCSHPKRYATREGLIYHILKSHDERQDDETESDDARTQTDTEDVENTVSDVSHGSSTETEM
ncbi:hypothetical protein K450DRAFT_262843 [Umbelopsis ramanniana AG]|uniref:C2H2-type domain-containing protein n=1 Tax=Umbelopsis ramanniana AG TaxID=1314678 RepID=A0AAD5E1E2_UMBRA|nr:uncharacterized protein K450DRAFT_262843 [Umbelopsis ramanniana AG]KAI8575227.1 hypothetical protein K450DRAFT_262843 [Umbelopsis ramanniana AG]